MLIDDSGIGKSDSGSDKRVIQLKGWGCSSVGRASDRHAADAGSIPPVRRGIFFFSPRVSFQCRLSYGVRTARRVQSHTLTSVRTLEIPAIGCHAFVWTLGNAPRFKSTLKTSV